MLSRSFIELWVIYFLEGEFLNDWNGCKEMHKKQQKNSKGIYTLYTCPNKKLTITKTATQEVNKKSQGKEPPAWHHTSNTGSNLNQSQIVKEYLKKPNFEFRNHIYSVYIFFIWTFWLKKAKTLTYFTQNCSGSVLDFHFCNQHWCRVWCDIFYHHWKMAS